MFWVSQLLEVPFTQSLIPVVRLTTTELQRARISTCAEANEDAIVDSAQ